MQGVPPLAYRVPPKRLVDHHAPGAGRVAQQKHVLRKTFCRVFHLLFVQVFCKDQCVVLVGFQNLFPTAFRAQGKQRAARKNGGGSHHLPQPGHELGVQNLNQPRQLRRFDALRHQGCYKRFHVLHGGAQVVKGGGRLKLPRNGQGMVGKIGKQVDERQNPHRLPLVGHHNAVDVVTGHEQQGVEKVVVLFAAQQRKPRALVQRGLVGNAVGHDVAKIAGGKNARAVSVAHKDGPAAVLFHTARRMGDGFLAIGKNGAAETRVADLDGKQALPFAAVTSLRQLAKLV